jgi:branched-chain amino acid transport system ATP-binding protein
VLLDVRDLSVAYGDIQAVRDVGFQLTRGELVSIIGANGAGKSSILNAVMGVVPIRSGVVRFNGDDISRLAAHRRARLGIRLVPERSRLFPRLSVYENLMTGAFGLRRQLPLKRRVDWLYELFPILGQRARQPASTLSGGEQQQLAIARALISDPQLLLVDEVSMGLMPKLVDRVFALLRQLNRDHGLTMLLVEQNAVASLEISDRAYVLETGAFAYQGEAHSLLEDERVKKAYLGR